MKLRSWQGPDSITSPRTSIAGVDWILAEAWWPYQRPTFVSPPFAGYVSGHSTFSRAAAEVLTMMTGDPFFPGGMAEFPVEKDKFLVFEKGPSVPVILQWATYRDASDQTSLSRIWGGIHPPVDDIPGRLIGEKVGIEAFYRAKAYFEGKIETASLKNLPLAFPNPVQHGANWTVHIKDGITSGNLQLTDLAGRLFWKRTYSGNIGTTLSISTTGLNSGAYILIVQHESGKQHIKLQLR
ncbi:MAG: T9SS type A sorting domain-containing protein [Bacteroidota bacterium]